MDKSSRILVTGANGMAGSALVSYLESEGHSNVIAFSRAECDLEERHDVIRAFEDLKPEFVFHLAAKVGGIQANMGDPVGFLSSNLLMQTHVLEACYKTKVRKTLFLGSSCIYPRDCRQPMHESDLLGGPLEPTNEGYALAKIAGLKLASYYSQQFGMNVVCPIPCNVYGPGDSFDLDRSHVLSALVRRFIDAKRLRLESVTLWGTGSARREFIYIEDLVRGMVFCVRNIDVPDIKNLGSGIDHSILELAQIISEKVGFEGAIEWDHSKPDGMPRKCMDVSQLARAGFVAKVPIAAGIDQVVRDYQERFPEGRP